MTTKETEINSLLEALAEIPVAYQRIYAHITGSVTAGLLLSQIVYWWHREWEGHPKKTPFYKTDRDFAEDLAMGMSELKSAKAKLRKMGIITIKRKGVPCRTFYNVEKTALLAKISSWSKIDQLDGRKSTNWLGGNRPTITDNTTKTTKDKDFSQTKLSSADARVRGFQLLLRQNVNQKVAQSIFYDKHTPLESIEETIKNGLARQKYEQGFILRPGYIVAALNGARKEDKVVTPTKKSKKLKQEINRLAKAKTQKPLSQKQFARKKKSDIKKLLAAS